MKMFLTLVNTHLNLNFGISALKYRLRKEKSKRWEPILIGVAIVVGFGPLIALYSLLMTTIFTAGLSLNQPEIVLTISFVFAQLLVLFFGIFYIMGAFYFSKDLDTLIPLPLKPYEVLGSKFAVVMINEYLTIMPILVPPIIIYGIGMEKGFIYWIKGILLILASPAIPLVIAALFVMILMRFVNVRKSKDLLAVIGGFLGIFIAFGINFFLQRIPEGNEQDFVMKILASQTGLIEEIGRKFPPSLWATFGLSYSGIQGIGYISLFIGVCIGLFIVLLWLGNQMFYRSLLSGQEVVRKRKVLSEEEMDKHYGKNVNPVISIFKREWKLLLRTPVYVLNGLAGTILGPFMLVFMFFAQKQSEETGNIFNIAQNPQFILPVTLVGLAVMLFTAGVNTVASTAVSREGQTFWVAKMIPVSPREQILGKFIQGLSVSFLGVISTGIVLIIFFDFTIYRVLIMIMLGVLGAGLLVALNLMIDVLHPKLVWSSPQEAMKQNMNALLGMLASVIVIAAFGGFSVIMITLGAPEWLIYTVLAILMAALGVPSIMGLMSLADRRYRNLEM